MCTHQVRPYGLRVTTDKRTTDTANGDSAAVLAGTQHYEIRVKGHLAARWSAWFDGLTLAEANDGTTVIRGPVVDQAALHGLLQKLRDVGIPLVSLTPVASDGTTTSGADAPTQRRELP